MSSNQSMNVQPDPTANLPDEVLCSIVSHIPSLPHRFKLAAVNNKFRRCVMAQLSKPMPLNIHFYYEHLNCHQIPIEKWPQAIEVLAPKAHFSEIFIIGVCDRLDAAVFDQVLSILSASDCLDQVRSFEVSRPGSPSLVPVLSQCPKLSTLRLYFPLRPWPSEDSISPSDVRSVVANKPLTELRLELEQYDQSDLIKLFECLQPNVLKVLHLKFAKMDSLNLAEFVDKSRVVWSGLSEIQLDYDVDTSLQIQMEMTGFFAPTVTALSELPLVQSCTINTIRTLSIDELVSGVVALFNRSKRQQPMAFEIGFYGQYPIGSLVFDLIAQLKQVHPDVQVDFYDYMFRLELDNASYVSPVLPRRRPDCLKSPLLYPVVINELMVQVKERTSMHLDNFRLDRCRVERVVADYSTKFGCYDNHCQALFAAINETGDLVVIAFEDGDGDQFYITIDRAHCLSGSCMDGSGKCDGSGKIQSCPSLRLPTFAQSL